MDNITPTHVISFLGILAGFAIVVKLFSVWAENREEAGRQYQPVIREMVKILQIDKIDVLNVRRAKVLVEDSAGNRHLLQYKGEPTFVAGDTGTMARQGDFILSFQSKQ